MKNHPGFRATLRHLHLEQELHFIARFIENIRHVIIVFGNAEPTITKVFQRSSDGLLSLVQVQQRPQRNPAVYDVFPKVASVVPAALYVEFIVADVSYARDFSVAQMSGWASPLGVFRPRHLDGHPATIVVKVG